MTRLGKILVFVNLFIGVGLFAWALSLYANRLDYFPRKDADPPVEGRFATLKKQVDELSSAATTAMKSYAFKSEQARAFESFRDYRLARLNERLALVRQRGDRPDIFFHQQILMRDPQYPGLIDDKVEGPVVRGVRNNELQGLGYLKSAMEQSVREEKATLARIIEARKKLRELSTRVDAVQAEVFKQKDIRANLLEERDYIADVKVNWDERLRVLQRRNSQLAGRLESLGVRSTKVTQAAPPAPNRRAE